MCRKSNRLQKSQIGHKKAHDPTVLLPAYIPLLLDIFQTIVPSLTKDKGLFDAYFLQICQKKMNFKKSRIQFSTKLYYAKRLVTKPLLGVR